MAWADDGDGGDGDGDGDDGGSSSSSSSSSSDQGGSGAGGIGAGETTFREYRRNLRALFGVTPPRPTRRAAPAPRATPRPTEAPREIIARGLSDADAAALAAQGYGVLDRIDLASLGVNIQRLSVPEGTTLAEARAAVQALPTGETADFNHYYRAEAEELPAPTGGAVLPAPCDGLHCPARALIHWPEHIGAQTCGAPVTIGMIDTGINTDHAALAGAQVVLTRVAPEDYNASDAIHGTAVAAILVGDPASRAPGLLPGLPLVAVDAFHKASGDERADVYTLVRGLDQLIGAGASVINLSLAGPPNTVLEDTLAAIEAAQGAVIVAAAGNGGPNAPPAYPAAYDSVIAVTAVDKGARAYRRAGRGPHVDLAAPGVEVWTAASVQGARWKTGTSFAAPYVTAAAALWRQAYPEMTPAEIRAALSQSAADLGAPGVDEVFGHGLLDLGGRCPVASADMLLPVLAE
jgi:subtilisin family serine protease